MSDDKLLIFALKIFSDAADTFLLSLLLTLRCHPGWKCLSIPFPLNTSRPDSSPRPRSFSYWAPKQWNSLPSDVCYILILPCLQNCVEGTSINSATTNGFSFCPLFCPPPPLPHYIPSVHLYVCVCVILVY